MAMVGRPEDKGKTLNAFLVGKKCHITTFLTLKNDIKYLIANKCAATSPVYLALKNDVIY